MKGRLSVPNSIKKAKHTFRNCRDSGVVEYPEGTPEPPPGLAEDALLAWSEIAPLLHQAGVLSTADRVALVRLCDCIAEINAADQSIRKHGLVYETEGYNGGFMIKANPAIRIKAEADRRLLNYLTQFGLTPATRNKIKAEPPEAVDPTDAYFN